MLCFSPALHDTNPSFCVRAFYTVLLVALFLWSVCGCSWVTTVPILRAYSAPFNGRLPRLSAALRFALLVQETAWRVEKHPQTPLMKTRTGKRNNFLGQWAVFSETLFLWQSLEAAEGSLSVHMYLYFPFSFPGKLGMWCHATQEKTDISGFFIGKMFRVFTFKHLWVISVCLLYYILSLNFPGNHLSSLQVIFFWCGKLSCHGIGKIN